MILRHRLAVMAGSLVLFSGLFLASATAQQGQGGSGLQISPPRTDLSLNPGESRTFSVRITNVTQGDLTAQTFVNDFESDNVSGNPKLIVDTNNRTPYTLAEMITGLEDFDLNAGQTRDLELTINVPTDTAPGAYFSAVRFAAIPKGQSTETDQDNQQQVALTASLAHLVFVEVPGEINEQIQINSFKLERDGMTGQFFWSAPNKAHVSVTNLGNGFSRPFGKVTISRAGTEIYSYDINSPDPNNSEFKGIVLPESSRTFTNEVSNITSPGRYTATALVAYGNGSEVLNSTISFWYVPFWIIVLLVIVIAAVAFGGYKLYNRRFTTNKKKRG